MSSENQSFLDEGATGLPYICLVKGGQLTRLSDGTSLVGCNTLKEVLQAIEKVAFLTHSEWLKGHLVLTYLIKNQPMHVESCTSHTLLWILEYVMNWLFAGLLSVNYEIF